ncbi:MAG TPA: hypothetical protein VMT18_13135 [Planctomycetota bacterium]|nr:hypothetical protein [Planctomycetota bacterium]
MATARTPDRPTALSLALLLAACASTAESQRSAGAPRSDSASAASATKSGSEPVIGTVAPAAPSAVALWPREYAGELLVLEALPQGASVAQGDVLVRLDTERIEKAIREAELNLGSAEVAHAGLIERHALADEAAALELVQARARLERAQRALEAFKTREAEFNARNDQLRERYERQSIEDRVDELAQVEAMYEADELVDATEEIVLKRSRRDLDTARFSTALSADRRAFEVEIARPMQLEAREEEVAAQTASVERLVRSQAIDARAREDAAARSALALEDKRADLQELRADLELFTLRAPADGVLLYGELDDYRPGAKPPLVERGGRLTARSEVLMVADPRRLAIAFDLSETQRAGLAQGASVVVRPLSRPDAELTAELSIEPFPAPRPAGKDGALFAARATLPAGDHELLFGMQAKVELGATP